MTLARAARDPKKRLFDLAVATTVLVLGAPILTIIALAIKLSSPGPILFRQQRIGLRGRPFTVLKFRSMVDGADESRHREYVAAMITAPATASPMNGLYKLSDDDRVTRIGRWLRATSLDEVPQLINVLKGEMSIVGPRPPLPYEVELYEPWQVRRLSVRPGLTGAWQVSGRSRLSYLEMCQLDVAYVDGWSLRQDLAIVVRTPFAMIRPGGTA